MGILCVFCIYDTTGNDVNIVSKNGQMIVDRKELSKKWKMVAKKGKFNAPLKQRRLK